MVIILSYFNIAVNPGNLKRQDFKDTRMDKHLIYLDYN